MADTTKIQYTDYTLNPWIGCSKVHTGCQNCYAEEFGTRFGVKWGPNGTRRKTAESTWRKPLVWDKKAKAEGVRRRVMFSLGDPFEAWDGPIVNHLGYRLWREVYDGIIDYCYYCYEDDEGPVFRKCKGFRPATLDDLRCDLFRLIDETPNLNWLLFTKRPENVRTKWPKTPWEHCPKCGATAPLEDREERFRLDENEDCWECAKCGRTSSLFRSNVHLIYSASNQETLEAGLPHLLKCRDLAPVLGLSLEPLLGPVVIPPEALTQLDWVAVGGESGRDARPCNIAWIRSVVAQCRAAGVACYVKQLGASAIGRCGHPMGETSNPIRWPLKHPKGGDPSEWPEDLRVFELPKVEEIE